jgi:hypothetical protein
MLHTLKTDRGGSYALWLDYRNNPLQMIAALDGWQPQVTTAKIKQLQTTTANFALKPDQACPCPARDRRLAIAAA